MYIFRSFFQSAQMDKKTLLLQDALEAYLSGAIACGAAHPCTDEIKQQAESTYHFFLQLQRLESDTSISLEHFLSNLGGFAEATHVEGSLWDYLPTELHTSQVNKAFTDNSCKTFEKLVLKIYAPKHNNRFLNWLGDIFTDPFRVI